MASFTEKNPHTGKTWRLSELHEAYLVEKAKNASTSKIISWEAQRNNIQERWDIHLREWDKAVHDCYQAGVTTRKFYNRTFA